MGKRDGQQKGPQNHAEGQHGERTHSRFLEQIHQPLEKQDDLAIQAGVDEPGVERVSSRGEGSQPDDADANSGRNRHRR